MLKSSKESGGPNQEQARATIDCKIYEWGVGIVLHSECKHENQFGGRYMNPRVCKSEIILGGRIDYENEEKF